MWIRYNFDLSPAKEESLFGVILLLIIAIHLIWNVDIIYNHLQDIKNSSDKLQDIIQK